MIRTIIRMADSKQSGRAIVNMQLCPNCGTTNHGLRREIVRMKGDKVVSRVIALHVKCDRCKREAVVS